MACSRNKALSADERAEEDESSCCAADRQEAPYDIVLLERGCERGRERERTVGDYPRSIRFLGILKAVKSSCSRLPKQWEFLVVRSPQRMEAKSVFSLQKALVQPVKMCMFDFPVSILEDLVSVQLVCVLVLFFIHCVLVH